MKKIILLSVVTLALFTMGVQPAHAKRKYSMGGCGVGSLLFGENKSAISQSSAATTNAASYTQATSITFGISNCVPDGGDSASAVKIQNFVAVNKSALEVEAARGQGEALASLSEMLGCSDSQHFSNGMKSGYAQVFAGPQDRDGAVLSQRIVRYVQSSELSGECREVL